MLAFSASHLPAVESLASAVMVSPGRVPVSQPTVI